MSNKYLKKKKWNRIKNITYSKSFRNTNAILIEAYKI